jgi:hypothetical protein
MIRMIATQCRNCGARASAFARVCAHCGARNAVRTPAFAIATVLAMLVAAGGFTVFAFLRGPGPAGQSTAAPGTDHGWITKAMADCDAEAAKEPSGLEFLVVPLKLTVPDTQPWRKKSLNDIGNAILLPADDALAGLNSGALTLTDEAYVFSIRDDVTNVVYKWSPSNGVKKFVSPDADAIERFKVQFQLRDKPAVDAWGAVFVRHRGTCYWVNAILGN